MSGGTTNSFRAGATPIVPAYHLRSSPAHIGYWCPWCRYVHLHGAAGGDGGRGAHCYNKVSPFYGRGINLMFAGTISSSRAIPRMSPDEMIALSNQLTAFGGDYSPWQPSLDAACKAVARRR